MEPQAVLVCAEDVFRFAMSYVEIKRLVLYLVVIKHTHCCLTLIFIKLWKQLPYAGAAKVWYQYLVPVPVKILDGTVILLDPKSMDPADLILLKRDILNVSRMDHFR